MSECFKQGPINRARLRLRPLGRALTDVRRALVDVDESHPIQPALEACARALAAQIKATIRHEVLTCLVIPSRMWPCWDWSMSAAWPFASPAQPEAMCEVSS